MEITSLLEWSQHWGLRQQPAGQMLSSSFGQGQQLELSTLTKSDMSYREPNFPWYLQSVLYCACTNYLVASTVISINLSLFLRTDHAQTEIKQDWKLLSLADHQNATLLRRKAQSMTHALHQRLLPRYGLSVGQHSQLAHPHVPEWSCSKVYPLGSHFTSDSILPFHFPLLARYQDILTKGIMNIYKTCYFPVRIRGWIPGAALLFLTPYVHGRVVAPVSSSFILSLFKQETSLRAVSFVRRAEAICESPKCS